MVEKLEAQLKGPQGGQAHAAAVENQRHDEAIAGAEQEKLELSQRLEALQSEQRRTLEMEKQLLERLRKSKEVAQRGLFGRKSRLLGMGTMRNRPLRASWAPLEGSGGELFAGRARGAVARRGAGAAGAAAEHAGGGAGHGQQLRRGGAEADERQ